MSKHHSEHRPTTLQLMTFLLYLGAALVAQWRRKWQPTPVPSPGKSHGWRRLMGYSPWGLNESDTTERLHFTSLLVAQKLESACNVGDLGLIPGLGRSPGEGTGTPFQYSCLENSMDRQAWQATVFSLQRVGHDLATNTYYLLCLGRVPFCKGTETNLQSFANCLFLKLHCPSDNGSLGLGSGPDIRIL